MSDIAIKVDNIGKRYRLGASRAPGTIMLREAIVPGEEHPELLMRVTRNEIEDLAHH